MDLSYELFNMNKGTTKYVKSKCIVFYGFLQEAVGSGELFRTEKCSNDLHIHATKMPHFFLNIANIRSLYLRFYGAVLQLTLIFPDPGGSRRY